LITVSFVVFQKRTRWKVCVRTMWWTYIVNNNTIRSWF